MYCFGIIISPFSFDRCDVCHSICGFWLPLGASHFSYCGIWSKGPGLLRFGFCLIWSHFIILYNMGNCFTSDSAEGLQIVSIWYFTVWYLEPNTIVGCRHVYEYSITDCYQFDISSGVNILFILIKCVVTLHH
jgi:hypothetical protein